MFQFVDETKMGDGADGIEEAGRLWKDLDILGELAKRWEMEYCLGKMYGHALW